MLRKKRNVYHRGESEHTPILAIWYQTRVAFADLIIPMLAGLKTVWLLLFSPFKFFHTYFDHTKPIEKLRTPFDPVWRALTKEERFPLDPAQFLLFGIFTAALAGFDFSTSNRFLDVLRATGITKQAREGVAVASPSTETVINNIEQAWNSAISQNIFGLFDQTLISAITELIVTLIITMFFAFVFYLLVGRRMSATRSYSFWLFMIGLQFFTTGISSLMLSVTSLPTINLPEFIPGFFYSVQELFFSLLWLLIIPTFILPRLHPETGLTAKRVIFAIIAGRGVIAGIVWFALVGYVSLVAIFGAIF